MTDEWLRDSVNDWRMPDRCLIDEWPMMVMDDNWQWLRMTDDDLWWMIRQLKYLNYGWTKDDDADWWLMTDDWRLMMIKMIMRWWRWHVHLVMNCGCNHIIFEMRHSSHPCVSAAVLRHSFSVTGWRRTSTVVPSAYKVVGKAPGNSSPGSAHAFQV